MALYIQIRKLDVAGDAVQYAFGPASGHIGRVSIDKSTGDVRLVEIDPEYRTRQSIFFVRVQRTLFRHFRRGEFPERTSYGTPPEV